MGRRGPRHGAFRPVGGGGGGRSSDGGGHSAAPAQQQTTPAVITVPHPPVQGPHPGFVKVAAQYTVENQLRQMLRDNGCDPSREVSYRLQGVQLIDNVREALQLPVKTFATACTYYHKFRLHFRNAEYSYQDAALAALLVACKVEDTIKKSRDILCASYNLNNRDKPLTQDDKLFEDPSRVIVGLDRIILQTVSFDFRARHPHKILIKLVRKLIPADDARGFLAVAYPMIIDLYKTFAPLKQTSFTMALAVIELTARVLNMHIDKVVVGQPPLDERNSHTTRACVIETIMDLLDLYTEFNKSTKIGPRFELNKFIDIKIKINKEVEGNPSTFQDIDQPCEKCEASKAIASMAGRTGGACTTDTPAASPSNAKQSAAAASNGTAGPSSNAASGANPGPGPRPGSGSGTKLGSGSGSGKKAHEGTMRYILESEKVRAEEAEVANYYKEEYDEIEVEVEELIPVEPMQRGGGGPRHNNHNSQKSNHNSHGGGSNGSRSHRPSQRDRNSHSHRGGGGHSGGANGNGNGESGGWAPYPRSRNDRNKNRKGGHSSGNGGGNGGSGSGGGGYY